MIGWADLMVDDCGLDLAHADVRNVREALRPRDDH
jgi:hypothetical protein